MYIFQQKIKLSKPRLKKWNKDTFGNIFHSKSHLEKELEEVQQSCITEGITEDKKWRETTFSTHSEEKCKQEEILWKQKYRVSWMKDGERNIAFFHISTIQHRMHNRIVRLKSDTREKINTREDIEKELTTFYKISSMNRTSKYQRKLPRSWRRSPLLSWRITIKR